MNFPSLRLGWGVAVLFAVMYSSAALAADEPRPNILFILSDDHAAHAIGSYGSRINQTPHIDRLAQTGMRFANCFAVNSICTPSRASILTGKYSHKNGVTVFNEFDGAQPHLAKYLQQAGYQTAVIGKWHLFSHPTGFDYWNVLPGQGRYHDPVMIEMGRTNKLKGYASDLITDLSIDFLKRRDPKRPFFLCTHHKAPHREWSPDTNHAALYHDRDIPEPLTFHDDYRGRSRAAAEATMRIDRDLRPTDLKETPPAGLSPEARKSWNYQRYIKDYLRCVASMDDNIGRLLDHLEATGLRTNTLVIYTSDQGFFLGDHGWFDKRFIYEESIRMPFLASFPGRIRPRTVNEQMVLNVDFAPTLLEFAGLPVPADMQGRSFRPLLEGRRPRDWRTSMYYRYYHYPGDHRVQSHTGVRTERHKLVHFDRLDEWELYDLKRDPHETNNVYADRAQAGTVRQLKTELARLKTELDDRDQFVELNVDRSALKPVKTELVLRYEFKRGEDGLIADASGAGLAGKLTEGEIVPGRRGTALRLGGKGFVAPVKLPAAASPAAKPLAVGAWCKPASGDGVIAAWGGAAHGFTLNLKGGRPHFALRASGELHSISAPAALPMGQWSHVLATLDSAGKLILWVDGRQVAGGVAPGIASRPADGLSIGADAGSAVGEYEGTLPWTGDLEDLRLYWGEPDATTLDAWRE